MHTMTKNLVSWLGLTLGAFTCFSACGSSGTKSSPGAAGGEGGEAADSTTTAGPSTSSGGVGGTQIGPGDACQLHQDCDDRDFCNGEERCDPTNADADESGCVPGSDPCPTASCDEDAQICVTCDEGDVDEDGHAALSCGGDDCDDNDDDRYPGNTEVCDAEGHDEDCDLDTLGGPSDADKDDDQFDDAGCCNELPDGELACGTDCDDDQSGVNPGSPEACNDIDDNCDGDVDLDEDGETLKLNWYEDRDADGHGLTSSLTLACAPPDTETQWVNESGDCLDDPDDENSAGVNPGVAELCDDRQLDENCSGIIDENCPCLPSDAPRPCGPVDENGDLLLDTNGEPLVTGRCTRGTQSCVDAQWADDCVGWVGPIPEICTDENLGEDDDENCDGITDGDAAPDDLKETRYRDGDGDGFGLTNDSQFSCEGTGDYTADTGGDCNDDNDEVNSGQVEACNGIDDNCDDILDGTVSTNDMKYVYFRDQDHDDFGLSSDSELLCGPSGNYTTLEGGDCDDGEDLVYPTQTEACNGIDDNCNGILDGTSVNNDLKSEYYRDKDLDTYGSENTTASYCTGTQPSGWVLPPDSEESLDCNDNNPNINPEATETCDGVDQNCNGTNDNNDNAASSSCEITGQIASADCDVDTCVVESCLGTYLDCDNDYDCETNGDANLDHCGECNNGCWLACNDSDCDEVEGLGLGYNHSCAVTSQGRVACWGANDLHQVSSSNSTPMAEPELVTDVTGAKTIAAGYNHTCAVVGTANEVWCWGSNAEGQLGHTPSTSRNPSAVDDGALTGATDVAGGGFHSCAVVAGGEVRCWGQRSSGQLGNGSTAGTPLSNASAVVLADSTTHLTGIADVTAGESHTCARTTGGSVYCWGSNASGELGTGGSASPNPVATSVSGLSGVDMLVAGTAHTCALVSGNVFCWGNNGFQQLGQATGSSYPTPTQISGLTDAVAISAGALHTCAIRAAGSVVCWGNNEAGERGDAAPAAPSATRVTVSSLSASLLASGGIHNCAVRSNGAAVCWGNNVSGQLGNGATSSTHLIQAISPL